MAVFLGGRTASSVPSGKASEWRVAVCSSIYLKVRSVGSPAFVGRNWTVWTDNKRGLLESQYRYSNTLLEIETTAYSLEVDWMVHFYFKTWPYEGRVECSGPPRSSPYAHHLALCTVEILICCIMASSHDPPQVTPHDEVAGASR